MKKVLSLLALLALIATPALADRSMAGSYVVTDPISVTAGTTVPVMIEFYNGSVDVEWMTYGFVQLPSNLTFVSVDGYDNPCSGSPFDITISGGLLEVTDPDGGWGNLYDMCSLYVFTTVEVPADAECGWLAISWGMQGDIYGDEPHYVEGTTDFEVVCTTGTENSDWSTLKALY